MRWRCAICWAAVTNLVRPIVLVGFMGAGKSKIGRLLAERLGVPFADSDAEIEREFGLPVPEIFATHGEPSFRAAEQRVIAELLGKPLRVIAVGGGAFVDPENQRLVNASADTIWLDPPFEIIAERIARSNSRPLASSRSVDELRELWEQRRPSYAGAHLRIETADDDPQRVVDAILDRLAR